MTHLIDYHSERISTIGTGTITFEEVKNHLEKEIQSGALVFPELIDASEAEIAFDIEEVRKIVEFLKRSTPDRKLARRAFVTTDTTSFGVLRMLSQMASGVCTIEVFRERKSAEEWLGWTH